MLNYRFFCFDRADHIVGAEVAACPSDADAMAVAPGHLARHAAVEVWQLGRQVGRIGSTSPGGSVPKGRPLLPAKVGPAPPP